MTKQQIIEAIPTLSNEDLSDLTSIFNSIKRGENLDVSLEIKQVIIDRAKVAKKNGFKGIASNEVFRKIEAKYDF